MKYTLDVSHELMYSVAEIVRDESRRASFCLDAAPAVMTNGVRWRAEFTIHSNNNGKSTLLVISEFGTTPEGAINSAIKEYNRIISEEEV